MNRCVDCGRQITEIATRCRSCAGGIAGKRAMELHPELHSMGGKIGGKRAMELHPNLASERGKIGGKRTHELHPDLASKMGRMGGKRTKELHPNLASEIGKKVHELHPNQASEMGKIGGKIGGKTGKKIGGKASHSYERKGIKNLRTRNVQVTTKGWPDCFCVSQKGKRFCVEFKPSFSYKLSCEQKIMIHELQKCGMKCYVGNTEGKLRFIKRKEDADE